MPVTEKTELVWKGPLSIGKLPIQGKEEYDELMSPGVYVFLGTYDNSQQTIYVGKASSLLNRYQEHLIWWLGGGYSYRNSNCEKQSINNSNRMDWFNKWEEHSQEVYADVRRQRFFYAPCPHFDKQIIRTIEARLIGYSFRHHEANTNWIVENLRRETEDTELQNVQIINNLDSTPELALFLEIQI